MPPALHDQLLAARIPFELHLCVSMTLMNRSLTGARGNHSRSSGLGVKKWAISKFDRSAGNLCQPRYGICQARIVGASLRGEADQSPSAVADPAAAQHRKLAFSTSSVRGGLTAGCAPALWRPWPARALRRHRAPAPVAGPMPPADTVMHSSAGEITTSVRCYASSLTVFRASGGQ